MGHVRTSVGQERTTSCSRGHDRTDPWTHSVGHHGHAWHHDGRILVAGTALVTCRRTRRTWQGQGCMGHAGTAVDMLECAWDILGQTAAAGTLQTSLGHRLDSISHSDSSMHLGMTLSAPSASLQHRPISHASGSAPSSQPAPTHALLSAPPAAAGAQLKRLGASSSRAVAPLWMRMRHAATLSLAPGRAAGLPSTHPGQPGACSNECASACRPGQCSALGANNTSDLPSLTSKCMHVTKSAM